MFEKKIITSFEKVTLRLSGMRCTEEYEILRVGDSAELSRYSIMYRSEGDERILENRVKTDAAVIIGILNDCRILSWDGFSGKNPRGVRDGTMFSFNAVVNDGKRIYANGSNNFPKRYRDFTDSLREMLRDNK